MNEPYAITKIYGLSKSGERFPIHIEIGKPYHRKKYGDHDWACPLSLKPLYENLAESAGINSIHSLCLGLSLIFDLLAHFREDGGRLEYEDGTEFTLEGYAFGQVLRGNENAT